MKSCNTSERGCAVLPADLTFCFNFNLAHDDIRIGALNANTDAGGHERRSAISDPAIAAMS